MDAGGSMLACSPFKSKLEGGGARGEAAEAREAKAAAAPASISFDGKSRGVQPFVHFQLVRRFRCFSAVSNHAKM